MSETQAAMDAIQDAVMRDDLTTIPAIVQQYGIVDSMPRPPMSPAEHDALMVRLWPDAVYVDNRVEPWWIGYGNRRDGDLISTIRLDVGTRSDGLVCSIGYESILCDSDEHAKAIICCYVTRDEAIVGHHRLLEVVVVEIDEGLN